MKGGVAMSIQIVYETHSISVDNEAGLAAGWLPSRLSDRGRELARELGRRRQDDGLRAVFCSDLQRAQETARIAFSGTGLTVLADWRLRECDYGQLNGRPSAEVHDQRRRYLDTPYPGGESWRQAVARVTRFLPDLGLRWENTRVLVIGHLATRYAFEHVLHAVPLETLLETGTVWQAGWEYLYET
jgi:2,3-bisphosphoglycerate-dependent phosphoglycerate mutase